LNEKQDALLLDLEQGPNFTKPMARSVKQIEKFIPAWINLPHIQAVISASGSMSSATGAGSTGGPNPRLSMDITSNALNAMSVPAPNGHQAERSSDENHQ
jgi:hypothetical protein